MILIHADARSLPLADASVQCVVTSPPYWGLRDYGIAGQLGVEASPDAYVAQLVAVFREVRRVLRDDGTVWLNLGDSYAAGGHGGGGSFMQMRGGDGSESSGAWAHRKNAKGWRSAPNGLKPKDLVGIPWRVAFALQQPQYNGHIARIEDRIWLAAAIDAEGCIFIHKRKAGQNNGQGYQRQHDSFGSGLEVANTSELFTRRCLEITGKGSVCHQDGHGRKQRIYRWNLRSNECRGVLQEVYPFLVAKRQQARLAIGCPSSGKDAEAAHAALMGLHNGFASDVDFKAPESLFGPGWYLRSDIIWSKLNPMPESVTDRPTRSHEYLFLLSKNRRYYYNAAAIREPYSASTLREFEQGYDGQATKDYDAAGVQNPSSLKKRMVDKQRGHVRRHAGFNDRWDAMPKDEQRQSGANKRSVWTVAPQPYAGAHFATMPEALVEPCILAGTKPGDRVLDPFVGSGTVVRVALSLGRRGIGCDLNAEYLQLARERTHVTHGLPLELPA